MKISNIIIAVVALAIATACNSDEVRISGKFIGLNAKTVYLEKISPSGQSVIDSTELAQNGEYLFRIKNAAATPSLYNIVYNGDRIPLLLTRGEHAKVGALGNVLANYTVSGSEESELLCEFYREFLNGQQALRETLSKYSTASKSEQEILTAQYNTQYRDIKRKQISFIIENKDNVAAAYALYQRLPGDQYLSSPGSDIIYFRTVANALSQSHPAAPLLVQLNNDIARMEAHTSLLKSIDTRSYPDLKGPDMFGKEVALSSLDGNVILVDFWSAELGNSNAFNADLKEIYEEYHDQGFRVYQVSADTSKAEWIRCVQEQRLPWISVCDFLSINSPMLQSYNVTKLPSNFLIDRNGNIIAKDLYSDELENRLKEIFH
ncbi:MAG: AhpC/TSA family protein [Alistipes sp.]|nr:AhpC/TSA family protein [Alistipes sp.]MBQ5836494.1 AhpC/TSA family protein [Alistipes sp.]